MNPDPVCSQRSDPDPVQIGPDPQHCSEGLSKSKERFFFMSSVTGPQEALSIGNNIKKIQFVDTVPSQEWKHMNF